MPTDTWHQAIDQELEKFANLAKAQTNVGRV